MNKATQEALRENKQTKGRVMMKKSILIALVLVFLLLSSCAAPTGVSSEEDTRVGAEFEAVREELKRTEVVTEQTAIDIVKARLSGLAQSDGAKDYLNSFNEWVAWGAQYLEPTGEFKLGYWRVWAVHSEELTPEREGELREQGYWFSDFGIDKWRRFAPPDYPHWGYAGWIIFGSGIVMPSLPSKHTESSECAMRVEWDLMWLSAGMSGTYPMDLVKLIDITE